MTFRRYARRGQFAAAKHRAHGRGAQHLADIMRKNRRAHTRYVTAVSSFYSWCLRRGDVRANPVAGLPRPTGVDYDTSATPGLTRDQAVALLEAADGDADPQAARTAALAATGDHVGEAGAEAE